MAKTDDQSEYAYALHYTHPVHGPYVIYAHDAAMVEIWMKHLRSRNMDVKIVKLDEEAQG